jgi:hypothetical protein
MKEIDMLGPGSCRCDAQERHAIIFLTINLTAGILPSCGPLCRLTHFKKPWNVQLTEDITLRQLSAS